MGSPWIQLTTIPSLETGYAWTADKQVICWQEAYERQQALKGQNITLCELLHWFTYSIYSNILIMYNWYVNLPIIHLSKNTRKCSIVKNTLHTLINLQTNQVCVLCFVSGLSDKPTLKCCRNVSRHWRYLVDDLVLDQNAKKVLRNQVLIMQVWDFTVMNLYIHILVIDT